MCVSRKQRNILHKIKHRGFVYVKKILNVTDKRQKISEYSTYKCYVERITNEQPTCKKDSEGMIMEFGKIA